MLHMFSSLTTYEMDTSMLYSAQTVRFQTGVSSWKNNQFAVLRNIVSLVGFWDTLYI